MLGCGCKNKHRKETRLKEIRLRAHKMLTKLGLIINIKGGEGPI